MNVALVRPALTVTLDGTVSTARLLDRLTTAPPVGAACVNLTVQVEVPPLATGDGAQLNELTSTAPLTVTVAV